MVRRLNNCHTCVVVLRALLLAAVVSHRPLLLAAASETVGSPAGDACAATAGGDACAATAGGDASEDNVASSPWAFMKAFSKLGTSWKHVIGEFKSVVKGADGVDLEGDIHAADLEQGLTLLRVMIREAASKATSQEDERAWSFRTTPLEDFGKTVDDVLLAFLRWSVVDRNSSHDDRSCPLIGGVNDYPAAASAKMPQNVNVSKAFRRLGSYVQWMKSVSADLMDPLTLESISPSLSTFSIHITHDACGRLVWWVDLGKTDMSAFKSRSPRETTRLFVWVAHLLFLDEGAQTEGLVVVDDMAEVEFYDYMTMLPVKVGLSLDRFLISVTPLKAKHVVLMHLPKWAGMGYSLLSWFLTARMKSRVTIVVQGEEGRTFERVVGGADFVPSEFGTGDGRSDADLIARLRDVDRPSG